jgi:hypothetical protein
MMSGLLGVCTSSPATVQTFSSNHEGGMSPPFGPQTVAHINGVSAKWYYLLRSARHPCLPARIKPCFGLLPPSAAAFCCLDSFPGITRPGSLSAEGLGTSRGAGRFVLVWGPSEA